MAEDKEAKHGGHKNGRRGGISGGSFFTWFMVIALLGVWTSVAVVWFDLVDYEEVLGKLGVYDADGDGDFDVGDAKVLLGLTKDGSNENIDSLEEVLNILAEESSDWFYGFLSFLYDVMTPFERIVEEEEDEEEEEEESKAADGVDEGPGGLAKRKTKAKAKEPSKEDLKKEREKVVPSKEDFKKAREKVVPSKSEERTSGKKKEEDKKGKKADSDTSRKASSRGKKDREAEKANPDRSAKSRENLKKGAETKASPSKVASRDKGDKKGRNSSGSAHIPKDSNQKRKK